MNPEESFSVTEFDKTCSSSHLQMLKAALPYLPPRHHGLLAVLIKLSEFKNTLSFLHQEPDSLQICEIRQPPPGPFGVLDAISRYGSPRDREQIRQAKQVFQMLQWYQQMEGQRGKDTDAKEEITPPPGRQSWGKDPAFNKLDPQKLSFLMKIADETQSLSSDQVFTYLTTLMEQSAKQGIHFTEPETDLILDTLYKRLSPAEQEQFNRFRQMTHSFRQGHSSSSK